jgi:5'-methylthioadenosine phosphorylase
MEQAQVGIIGGTGIGQMLLAGELGHTVHVHTPFGLPSAAPIVAEWEGRRVAVIARHGLGHRFNPSSVPYRANIWALKQLGVTAIIASGATGSLREDIEPGHLVLCDQAIDRTYRRAGTFFDEDLVAHVELSEPFCPHLRTLMAQAGERIHSTVHHAGTYICMEGPQFSTKAESLMHRQMGGDLIGMTCMPEAKLAREAEICYATIALPTDYDCWRPHDPDKPADSLLAEIMSNLRTASENALALIHETLKLIDPHAPRPCHCQTALKLAIWTNRSGVDPVVRKRLEPLIGRYFADTEDDGSAGSSQ